MKRRNFILGLGATAAGGSAVVGSGAFSSVEAERTVTVETATDNDAYLRLNEGEKDDRSFEDTDGVIGFTFTGLREEGEDQFDTNDEDPEGLGEDTIYRFGQETDGDPLFSAQNQGANPIEIHGLQHYDDVDPDDVPEIKIFDVETEELLTEGDRSKEIGVGDSINLGLQIDTHGVEVRETPYDLTLTIIAEATND